MSTPESDSKTTSGPPTLGSRSVLSSRASEAAFGDLVAVGHVMKQGYSGCPLGVDRVSRTHGW